MGRGLSIALITFLCNLHTFAAEADNYSLQNFDQPDVTARVNEYFNVAIDEVLVNWNPKWGADEHKFVRKVYLKLKGNLVSDRFTRWAKKVLPVHEVKKKESIYREVDLHVAPIFAIFGVGKSINIQGIPVGLDKVSHFLGAGYIMWERNYKRGNGLQDALDWAENTESRFLGQGITGVYSNGDLVADYEGMIFFRNLFHDDVLSARGPILRFEGARPMKLRSFDLLDHYTPFWSEAILPSAFRSKVKAIVERALPERCPLYQAKPHLYQIDPLLRQALNARYALLAIQHNDHLLMENVCK